VGRSVGEGEAAVVRFGATSGDGEVRRDVRGRNALVKVKEPRAEGGRGLLARAAVSANADFGSDNGI